MIELVERLGISKSIINISIIFLFQLVELFLCLFTWSFLQNPRLPENQLIFFFSMFLFFLVS